MINPFQTKSSGAPQKSVSIANPFSTGSTGSSGAGAGKIINPFIKGVQNQPSKLFTGKGYGVSNLTDPYTKKPLATFENQAAKESQLLNRIATTFDPTIPQKLTKAEISGGTHHQDFQDYYRKKLNAGTADELDHRIALELGGANVPSNLGLTPARQGFQLFKPSTWIPSLTGKSAQAGDVLENKLAKQVVNGEISLVDAHRQLLKAKGITLPEDQTLQGNQPKPKQSQEGFVGGLAGKILGTEKTNIQATAQNLIDKAANLGSVFIDEKSSVPQKIAAGAEWLQSLAQWTLQPITVPFDILSQVPVGKQITDAMGVVLGAGGKVVQFGADKALDILPISKESKAVLRQPIDNLANLAGQMTIGAYLLGKAGDILKAGKDLTVSKAREIVNKMPPEIAAGEVAKPEVAPLTTIGAKAPEIPQNAPKIAPEVPLPKELEPLRATLQGERGLSIINNQLKENPRLKTLLEREIKKGTVFTTKEYPFFNKTYRLAQIEKPIPTIPPELQPLAQEANKLDVSLLEKIKGKSNPEIVKIVLGEFKLPKVADIQKMSLEQLFAERERIANLPTMPFRDSGLKAIAGKMGGNLERTNLLDKIISKQSGIISSYIESKLEKASIEKYGYVDLTKLKSDFFNQAVGGVKETAPEMKTPVRTRAEFKEMIGEPKDAIDKIISGEVKMRPPVGIKTDWRETLGKGNYMRIFGGGKFANSPDEMASELGMTEEDLKNAMIDRMSQAGFISPSAAVESVKTELQKLKEGRESAKFGEKLRSYFVGERDVRIAETNQLRERLQKTLTPQEQEAITFYRDFKGRETELNNLLADPTFERYKTVINLALKPTEAMLNADTQITDFGRRIREEEQKLGILDTSIPDERYITHLLAPADVEGTPQRTFLGLRRARISRTDPFARGRTYETVADAIKAGVKVKTINSLDALTIRGEKWGIAASTKMGLAQLKDSSMGKFGFKGSENIPREWVPADPSNRYFRNTVPFQTEEGKPSFAYQDLYVPQKVADAMKPLVSTDFTGTLPGFSKTRFYQAYLKSIQLGLSVFHIRALNLTALNNEGLTGIIKSYANDMASPEFLEQERDMIKHGGQTPILGRTIEAYRGLADKTVPSRSDLLKTVPGVKQLDAFAKGLTKITFDIMQRKFKVQDYAIKVAKAIADNPNISDTELVDVKRSIAKEENAAYGGLNWEVLGWDKASLNMARFLLLAPDWTFSNFFNAKYAFEGGPAGSAARKFWIRSAITGGVLTYLTSTLITGKPAEPNFQNFTNVYMGKDKNGKDIYQNLYFAGAPNDAINLINNIVDFGAIQGFAQSVASKASPITRASIQALTNRNYLGREVIPKGMGPLAGTARSIYTYGASLGPVPFSLSTMFRMFTDPNQQYTLPEFITSLAGTRPRHIIPTGMRQVTSGAKKGQLVPVTPKMQRGFWEQVLTGKINEPDPVKTLTEQAKQGILKGDYTILNELVKNGIITKKGRKRFIKTAKSEKTPTAKQKRATEKKSRTLFRREEAAVKLLQSQQ